MAKNEWIKNISIGNFRHRDFIQKMEREGRRIPYSYIFSKGFEIFMAEENNGTKLDLETHYKRIETLQRTIHAQRDFIEKKNLMDEFLDTPENEVQK